MIYKNGVKEYVTMGLTFGVLFCIIKFLMDCIMWGKEFSSETVSEMIVVAVLSAIMFSGLMAIFSGIVASKMKNKRFEIASRKRIVCEGPATINGVGGWLFACSDTMEFYPHGVNTVSKIMVLPRNEIINIETNGSKLILATASARYVFAVNKSEMWKNDLMMQSRYSSQNYK